MATLTRSHNDERRQGSGEPLEMTTSSPIRLVTRTTLVAGRPTPRFFFQDTSKQSRDIPRVGSVSAFGGGDFRPESPCGSIKHVFIHANEEVGEFGPEDCITKDGVGNLDGRTGIRA